MNENNREYAYTRVWITVSVKNIDDTINIYGKANIYDKTKQAFESVQIKCLGEIMCEIYKKYKNRDIIITQMKVEEKDVYYV